MCHMVIGCCKKAILHLDLIKWAPFNLYYFLKNKKFSPKILIWTLKKKKKQTKTGRKKSKYMT